MPNVPGNTGHVPFVHGLVCFVVNVVYHPIKCSDCSVGLFMKPGVESLLYRGRHNFEPHGLCSRLVSGYVRISS
jgi:hypothetical protein